MTKTQATTKISYQQAGVDKEEGYKAVSLMKTAVKETLNENVLNNLGGFGAMYELPSGYKNPVLVSGADGVGTKLDIAIAVKDFSTVGIDCVAMCVNDILCHGAKPLYFLDYIACSKLDANIASQLVASMAKGMKQSNASLIGGETAEMPGFYLENKYDIAGFAVGIVEKSQILDSTKTKNGDILIGLESSGLHSNGFSLVRRLITDFNADFNGQPIHKTLLAPTKIYVDCVLPLIQANLLTGIAHITGGGLIENVPRMLGDNLQANINKSSLPNVPIIQHLQSLGADDVYNTFNMGIGMVLAVDPSKLDQVTKILSEHKQKHHIIGDVTTGNQEICLK